MGDAWSNKTYTAFIDPGIVLFMFMLPFIFVIVCGGFLVKRICAGSLLCVCMYVLSLEIQLSRGSARIPLTGLNSSYSVHVPSQDLGV